MDENKRKRGAQPGNRNARKHGIYSRVLTPRQQAAIPLALEVHGLDREIAIMRIKINDILSGNTDENGAALSLAMSVLHRLLRTRDKLAARPSLDCQPCSAHHANPAVIPAEAGIQSVGQVVQGL